MNKKRKNPKQITKKTFNFNLLAFLIIAVISILIYSNSFNCEFQFDDDCQISEQPIIKKLDNFTNLSIWQNINFRPLTMFTFAINYHFHKLDVKAYHVCNLIIHIIMCWFVFLLINLIFSLQPLKSDSFSKHKKYIALFGALICVTHPIQTQAVTYIVQRMSSLAASFYIIAIFLYAKARLIHIEKGINWNTIIFYIGASISGVFALFSKQNAVTFPLAMLLFELFFIRNRENKLFKKYLIISFSVLLLVFLAIAFSGNLPKETEKISRINYLITQFRIIVKYIQLLILPVHQNLDYNFFASTTFWNLKEIGSFLIILSLLISGVLLFRKQRVLSFGIFWFFLTLSLESSIFPISGIIYEHRLYLPMVGFSLCLITILWRLFSNKRKSIMFILLMIIIFSYGYATFNRNKVWKTRYTLWSDVVKKSPNKARPNYNLGNVWTRAGKHDIAIKYYNRAVKTKPDFEDALNNLGNAWKSKGNIEKASEYYNKVLEVNPNYTQALNNLGVISSNKGELDKAKEYYEKVLEIKPNDAEVINNLGIVWARKRQFDKAVDCFNRALEIQPDLQNAKKNLKIASQEKKQLE
ncbi:MAG: tetratricopeptide repeat protein [Armatimonadetes bacterium]|nr:tetratricopeptide repeat protein [Armatimonadota bacterium]